MNAETHMLVPPRRPGFTLVELLVVIALIGVLATLAIRFFPNAASSAREAKAAVTVQSALNIAKQRALRDQAPRGVRFVIDPNAVIGANRINNAVTELVYVEQPDDFSGGSIQSGSATVLVFANLGYSPLNSILCSADLVNGASPMTVLSNNVNPNITDPNLKYWSVQPGDYLEINGGGLLYRIVQVGVPTAPGNTPEQGNPHYVKIEPPLPYELKETKHYRILRAPRAVADGTLKLPADTIIDLSTNGSRNPLPFDPTGSYFDIVFSPSGEVITRGLTTDKIHLWVRMPDQDDLANVFRGDPTLVSVFVRTGFVGAFSPDRTSADPYDLVR